jgi:hypothetical protein
MAKMPVYFQDSISFLIAYIKSNYPLQRRNTILF